MREPHEHSWAVELTEQGQEIEVCQECGEVRRTPNPQFVGIPRK
jgi:hypothetical protein